jgi:Tannase and feruloyl esterase
VPAGQSSRDKLDGVADGLLMDPRACAYDPAALLCPNNTDAPDCLTRAQVDAASYERLLPMAGVWDASNTDLAAFRDRGGKLILYHGWADDSISPTSTIAYYAALQQRMGGLQATQQFARLFMFPGVYHCSGGEGPSHWDMVTAITDWVERGVAPTQIVATQYESDLSTAGGGFANPTSSDQTSTSTIVPTLPTFAYPLRPQYNGPGDVNDARSYVPVLPTTTTGDDSDWIGQDLLRR